MRILTIGLTLLFGFATSLVSQSDYRFENLTYEDNIQTVRFHVAGFIHSYPIIELNGSAQLRLSFDDKSEEVRRYTYRVIHCDQDWQPSGLSELEYIDGFTEDNIQDFDFSFRTLAEYVHYDLFFPNRDMEITKSGNYLLVVYEDDKEERTVITRRFYVVDSQVSLSGSVERAAEVNKIHTHQEVDLIVNVQRLDLRAPLQEVSLTVLQNNRWDNAITELPPNLVRGDQVQFNYQGRVSFAGGNEFRTLDIRSINAPRSDVLEITNEGTHYGMLLAPDRIRSTGGHLDYADLNGDFVNFRFDRPIISLGDQFTGSTYDRLNLDFTGDYVNVTFVLERNQALVEDDVYLFGGFTEFKKKPKFRMIWNPAIGAYVGQAMLKQGFYDYWYVTNTDGLRKIENNGSSVALGQTEGNYDDTENDYIGLVYYRPLGGRYDQIVGMSMLNSNTN